MPELPRGTVTFLFTDVEGSTRLLGQHGDAYAHLLADHRRMEVALLRSRGAGSARLGLLAGGEALLVALPSAVA